MASLLFFACVMSLILKTEGVVYGLCHEGSNLLFRFCVPCMPRCCTCLIPAPTMRGCHVAGFVRYLHGFPLNSTSFPDGKWDLFFVHLFSFHSWKCSETSVADKHNNCMPVLSTPKDHGGVFAHPCTTCSGGILHEWQNGDPLLRALGRGSIALCLTQRDAEVDE